MATPKLSPTDRETLLDLAMWQNKLRSLANVSVSKRWLGGNTAPVPAHSAAFYYNLPSWHLRWEATDGSGKGGAIGISHWAFRQNDPGYGFAPDEHFMIADLHNDQAMAFFRYRDGQSMDDAEIVGAAAGEEGEARFLASSIGSYVRSAIEARFGHYWFLRDSYASEARAWVDAQKLDPAPRFEITVASVEPPDAAALRALAIAWVPGRARARIAAAAGTTSGDPVAIAAALTAALQGKPSDVKKINAKLSKIFFDGPWQEALFFHKIEPDLRAVRLRAKRVGTAYMSHYREPAALSAAQILLDAPGADAIARVVNADYLRFCETRGREEAKKIVSSAFCRQPDKALRRGHVLGEIEITALVPAALVPTGCVAGARFASIAPANDGVLDDGRVLKSA